MNSFEEANQMSTNICFGFGLDVIPDEILEILRPLEHTIEDQPMDFDEFWVWFVENFAEFNTEKCQDLDYGEVWEARVAANDEV